MQRALETLAVAGCLWVCVFSASGCGTDRVAVAPQAEIWRGTGVSERVRVAWSNTREHANGFVVAGVLARDDTVGTPIEVSVYGVIVDADGRAIDEAQSRRIRVPRRRIGRIQGFHRFTVCFPTRPPEGASLQLTVRPN